ncbi:hypothetical protein [Actinoplanes regularis]|uniref:hypothetical protein n=1 Tax=Actinoplanes regularis TaxID=52697 RepID=UPI0024A50ACD|nr:hypothetical protein [Actinoplanes regularis]GLW33141.1 hypothetical protein Areg01_60790 [Actinoplanes regularis]
MSGRMEIVEWADVSGTGFSPQGRSSGGASPAHWAAAEAMLHEDLGQPPEGIRRTGGHPIWTLRRVPLGDRRTWCFVVQGRRGPFGVAGTSRFGFAPPGMDAYESWETGMAEVAGPHEPPSEDPPTGLLSVVLGGVLLRRPVIPIGTSPADTAWVIQRILGVLPERDARLFSWSTCLLQPPGPATSRVVSGRWPAEFNGWEPELGRAVKQVFAGGPVTKEHVAQFLDDRAAEAGFDDLVDVAAHGRCLPQRRRGDVSLHELILQFRYSPQPVRQEEVPGMLHARQGRIALRDNHRSLVREWARDNPAAAVRHLRAESDPVLGRELTLGLVQAQDGSPENLLGLPTAGKPGSADWLRRLAELLTDACDPDDLLRHAERWRERERPWASYPDLFAARGWLKSLGLTVDDAPGLFPVRKDLIIEELNRHHRITPAALEELHLVRRPVELIEEIAPELRALPPQEAEALIQALSKRTTDRRSARRLQGLKTRLTGVPEPVRPATPKRRRYNPLALILVGAATLVAVLVLLILAPSTGDRSELGRTGPSETDGHSDQGPYRLPAIDEHPEQRRYRLPAIDGHSEPGRSGQRRHGPPGTGAGRPMPGQS